MTADQHYVQDRYRYFTGDIRLLAEICDMSSDEANRCRVLSQARISEMIQDMKDSAAENGVAAVRSSAKSFLASIYLYGEDAPTEMDSPER